MRGARDFLQAMSEREPPAWTAEGALRPARIALTLNEDGRLQVAIPFGEPLAFHVFFFDEEDMDTDPELLAAQLMGIWSPIRAKLVAEMDAAKGEAS